MRWGILVLFHLGNAAFLRSACTDAELAQLTWGLADPSVPPVHCRPAPGQRLALAARDVRAPRKPTPLALAAGQSSLHALHLSVFLVDESWCPPPCHGPTWEVAAAKSSSPSYRLLEAAIWLAERRVALYEFDTAWADRTSKVYSDVCNNEMACPAYYSHREGARVFEVRWGPEVEDGKQLSAALKDAFVKVFDHALETAPPQFLFTYSGHGGFADGGLFAGYMSKDDAGELLESVVSKRGKKFDLMNFGGNCVEGRLNMLHAMQPFGSLLIASDLPVAGINFESDDEAMRAHLELRAEYDDLVLVRKLMEDQTPVRTAATTLLDGWQKIWDESKGAIAAQKLRQTKALFDLAKLPALEGAMQAEYAQAPESAQDAAVSATNTANCDVLTYATELGGACPAAWDALRIHFATTSKLFEWENPANGLKFNLRRGKCDLRLAGPSP